MSGYMEDAGFYPSSYTWDQSPQQDLQQHHAHAANTGKSHSFYNPLDYNNPAATSFMYSQQNQAAANEFNQVAGEYDDFANEPPLLEELGINFDHIIQKTLAVLNPFRHPDATIMSDSDLAGPFVFCMLFGGLLLLSGKIHFGYIYGIGILGCAGMYSLLTLMSEQGVSMGCIVSVLGYCLLPMVLLSAVSILFSLQGVVGTICVASSVLWCSWSASKLFVTALSMDHQQPLIAYPCALLYGVFSLLTVF